MGKVPTKIQGFNCVRIRCLSPVFREWIKGITEIAEEWKYSRDAPWWVLNSGGEKCMS